jgi:hypothetical protein
VCVGGKQLSGIILKREIFEIDGRGSETLHFSGLFSSFQTSRRQWRRGQTAEVLIYQGIESEGQAGHRPAFFAPFDNGVSSVLIKCNYRSAPTEWKHLQFLQNLLALNIAKTSDADGQLRIIIGIPRKCECELFLQPSRANLMP